MARIRTVKPDFWDDEKLAMIPRDARLTFIGMWNHSDDYGVCKGHPSWLKNSIFPYDDIKPTVFEKWLRNLVEIHSIIPFSVNGEKYYYIKNFRLHQFINRPSKIRNPEPPPNIIEDSMSPHGALTDVSMLDRDRDRDRDREGNSATLIEPSKNEDFIQTLKENPAFKHIDIDHELHKMDAWLALPERKGRKKTRKFVLNWLNKIEVPLEPHEWNGSKTKESTTPNIPVSVKDMLSEAEEKGWKI